MRRSLGPRFLSQQPTLDMHISQLRRKIEADPANPKIITTVRGTGYRFE
jgi:DNA-binding response OmpR family regulator